MLAALEDFELCIPSTHAVGRTTEDLGQAANHDIRIFQNLYVHEIPNRLINHHKEVVLVRKLTNPWKVGRSKERVGREFSKEGERSRTRL